MFVGKLSWQRRYQGSTSFSTRGHCSARFYLLLITDSMMDAIFNFWNTPRFTAFVLHQGFIGFGFGLFSLPSVVLPLRAVRPVLLWFRLSSSSSFQSMG